MTAARPPYRALVVSAHPDDLEFGAAGTVAKWADAGAEVTLCIVTDGSTGTQDRSLMGAPLAEVRRRESEAAARILGVSELVWLGYPDGYVEYKLGLRRDLARVFRRYRPHRYMVMDPAPTIEDRFINHPDHGAVGQASLDVTLTAGTTPGHFPELLDEGLEPWRDLREVWIMGPAGGPRVVDVTATVDRKIDALMCHSSQVGDNRAEIEGWLRGRLADAGAAAGYEYAESFRVIAQGPGFHADEQLDEVDMDYEPPPADPRAAPPRA
ncbi:MAG TPA: PIG-L deacetylase family protein [Actinomycetota bacterium]|nr:PIG-L deacetylase family protein [Actinomycetota bacterium]